MKDRDYQANPQTEEELKAARAVVLQERDHDYKGIATNERRDEDRNPFPIRGLEMGSLEIDHIRNEVFKSKQWLKEGRGQAHAAGKLAPKDKGKDYTELYNELKKSHISAISLSELTNIIEHHSITPDTNRHTWNGAPADAHRFTTAAGLTVKEFNNCFRLMDRKLKANDKDKHSKETDFTKLLSKSLSK